MTRLSGVDMNGRKLRKGAIDCGAQIRGRRPAGRSSSSRRLPRRGRQIARSGGTPLGLVDDDRLLGVIHLKDVVKPDVKDRFAALRRMGIKTVMITGDNPVTAAAIASEAGVDDFIAQATPEDKLRYIRDEQAQGRLIAMCGDGTNDAPGAGAGRCRRRHAERHAGRARGRQHGRSRLRSDQAHRGGGDRQATADDARRADHILDRQRRGEVFRHHPGDVRRLLSAAAGAQRHAARTPQSAILSAIIFNALIIIALIPLALKGVKYRPIGAAALLRRNLLVYGLGGIVLPFLGIKAIDLVVTALRLA